MSWETKRRFRILLAGYINVNVIDGSAFFLSGFAGMCARHPYVDVDLVTANPVRSWEVLDELAEYSNVDIIDPYSMVGGDPELMGREYMSKEKYASLLARAYEYGQYDAVLVRDNEVALDAMTMLGNKAHNFHAYVTGLTFTDQEPRTEEIQRLEAIISYGGKLVCQTQEIKDIVQANIEVSDNDIWILPPHVPDPQQGALATLEQVKKMNRLVYTGKFFSEWNVDSILATIKSLNLNGGGLYLDVAGDQFRRSESDKFFVDNVEYLLRNVPGVNWHGRVPRNISRALIARSHVGIGWRSGRLESSSELSTKILEYGALGRPSIVNRTPMHERLLGRDYPLFANSKTEFRELLSSLKFRRSEVLLAAQRCYQVAAEHSYSEVSKKALHYLGNKVASKNNSLSFINSPNLLDQIPRGLQNTIGKMQVNGAWVEFIPDQSGKYTFGELATIAEKDFSAWEQTIKVVRGRIEASVKSDDMANLGSANRSVRLESQDYENVKATRELLAQTQQERNELKITLESTQKRLGDELAKSLERENYWRAHAKTQSERLAALRESKFGRLQTWIWKRAGKQ